MTRFTLRAVPPLLCVLAISCGKSTVTVMPIAPGAQCPTGGTSISIDNGTPQIICNGSNATNGTNGTNGVDGGNGTNGTNGSSGFTTLVRTTMLAVGDANCASGGQQIDSGLDNGAHGGTANDGILQAGEITSTSYVCNGSGDVVGSIAAPSGATGDSTITAVGGSADAGFGGNSDGVYVQMWNGSFGGHVKVFKTGAADPSFAFPTAPTFDPGASPVHIAVDTTVGPLDPSNTDAGVGTLYIDSNNTLAMLDDAVDGGSIEATSLSISAGATLTLVPGSVGSSYVIGVNGSIFNSGSIVLGNVGARLLLVVKSSGGYFGDSTSQVLNNGLDGVLTNARSQRNSGSVADGTSSGGISISASPIWNRGLISANGGTGRNGGNGGKIDLLANGGTPTSLFNTGIVEANGGAGTFGSGGNAGSVVFEVGLDANNSGPLSAVGGSGTTVGGNGGEVGIYAGDREGGIGSTRNSGTIHTIGGSVDASCVFGEVVSCIGGNGGGVILAANNGTLVNNAALTSRGGSSANGAGGSGGQIIVTLGASNAAVVAGRVPLSPAGDLVLSGSVDSSGGTGATRGGNAGLLGVYLDPNVQPNGQEIILYGYARIDASGGSGAIGGGSGGEIQLENTYYSSDGCNVCKAQAQSVTYGPGGSVINDVDLVSRGGASGAGSGGSGGQVQLITQSSYYFPGDAFEQVRNTGRVDVGGGDGQSGGSGGSFQFYGLTGVTNSGPLTARGGVGLAASGGTDANSSRLTSDNGEVISSAAIDVSGGDGVTQGGGSAQLDLQGTTVTVSADLVAKGGAASASVGGSGGAGGTIVIGSSAGSSSISVAAPGGVSVAGGAAAQAGTPGKVGTVTIDGWNLTSSWTH